MMIKMWGIIKHKFIDLMSWKMFSSVWYAQKIINISCLNQNMYNAILCKPTNVITKNWNTMYEFGFLTRILKKRLVILTLQ